MSIQLSEVVGNDDFVKSLYEATGQGGIHKDRPSSFAVQPVFDEFVSNSATTRQPTIVGYLFAAVPWTSYFFGILSEGINGVIVEIEDTCGDSFCFQLNGGHVNFFEQGCPVHRQSHYDMQISRQFAEFARFSGAVSEVYSYLQYCSYKTKVIPSDTFEKQFKSNDPILFTVAVLSVFLFTTLVFFLYDTLVSRRQNKVMATATRTTAIVKSLFPKNVQERIMEQVDQEAKAEAQQKRNFAFGQSKKLKAFLTDGNGGEVSGKASQAFGSKPIADLFPSVTIMFCDVSISAKKGPVKES